METTEIQRYTMINTYDEEGDPTLMTMPDARGVWVRWEDVEKLQKSFIEKHHQVVNEITQVYIQLMNNAFSTRSMTCAMEVIEPPEMPK